MAEADANEEGRAEGQERRREDEEELKDEQDSAEAMDSDVPHPPGAGENLSTATAPCS